MQKYDLKINKKQENQAGITLVALVITVVIMLILAGVAIAAVVDGNGLFSKTREAKEVYENATENEEDKIQSMLNEIDRYIENPSNPVLKEVAELGAIVNENQTFDGRIKGTYNNPIIPKGFAPIGNAQDSTITEGAEWGNENGYQYGLVIEDESGNQFVWVPVDGTTVKFERVEWGTGYFEKDECEEVILPEITESVRINGGFYIARYEAGLPEGEFSSSAATDGSIKSVSKQGATVWNSIAWSYDGKNDDANPGDGAVTVVRSMYPEEDTNYGVASTLIYGIQWDTALKFIGAYDVGEANYDTYATNSTGMGNYSGTTNDSISGLGNCGANPLFRQKNIYDMAGNVWEWTMEKYSGFRVGRGGDYLNDSALDNPVSNRGNIAVTSDHARGRFSCCTLYKVVFEFKEKITSIEN